MGGGGGEWLQPTCSPACTSMNLHHVQLKKYEVYIIGLQLASGSCAAVFECSLKDTVNTAPLLINMSACLSKLI